MHLRSPTKGNPEAHAQREGPAESPQEGGAVR